MNFKPQIIIIYYSAVKIYPIDTRYIFDTDRGERLIFSYSNILDADTSITFEGRVYDKCVDFTMGSMYNKIYHICIEDGFIIVLDKIH